MKRLRELLERGLPLLFFGQGGSGVAGPPPSGPPAGDLGGAGVRVQHIRGTDWRAVRELERRRRQRERQLVKGAPGRLISRHALQRELVQRERALLTVIQGALRDIRRMLGREDLRTAAALGHTPVVAPDVARKWEQHEAAMIAALLQPVRVLRAEPDPAERRRQAALDALAEDLARRQIGALIRELSPAQLQAVRAQLAALMELGPTRAVLEAIGAATGLTARQTQAVAGVYRRQLEAGATPSSALRFAEVYADRLLDLRARTIARQEAVAYTNNLVLERGRQAAAGGGVITKQSVSARDDRVDGGNPRGICRVLDNGKRIPLDQPFVFEGQAFDGPPYHIGCRDLLEIWRES